MGEKVRGEGVMSYWRLRKGGVMLDGPRLLLSLSLSSSFNTTLQTFVLLMCSVAVQRGRQGGKKHLRGHINASAHPTGRAMTS